MIKSYLMLKEHGVDFVDFMIMLYFLDNKWELRLEKGAFLLHLSVDEMERRVKRLVKLGFLYHDEKCIQPGPLGAKRAVAGGFVDEFMMLAREEVNERYGTEEEARMREEDEELYEKRAEARYEEVMRRRVRLEEEGQEVNMKKLYAEVRKEEVERMKQRREEENEVARD